MSFFCSTGKATGGTIACKVANCPLLVVFPHLRKTSHRSHGNFRQFFGRANSNTNAIDAYFVNALVRAGQCNAHSSKRALPRVSVITRLRDHPVSPIHQPRLFTTCYRHQKESNPSIPAGELSTKEELIALVDQYDS